MLTAKVATLNAGYKSEQEEVEKLGWVLGQEFEIDGMNIGCSSSVVRIKDIGWFNSVFFEFHKNGSPYNIYQHFFNKYNFNEEG
jgi:hypothetical protein